MPAPSNPELQRVAASAAHALNNALGVLAAAADHLEGAAGEAPLRARRALATAGAGVQSVSEALTLLSCTAEDFSTVPRDGFAVREHDALRANEALAELAQVEPAPLDPANFPLPLPIDGETLKMLLVCMGVTLRREAGRQAVLRSSFSRDASGAGVACAWDIGPASPAAAGAPAAAPSSHPCGEALAHAATILPPGITLARTATGGYHLEVRQ